MYKKYSVALLIISLNVMILACKKEDKNQTSNVKDCEKNAYGILKVEYNSAFHEHSILLTPKNTTIAIEKISPIGILSDTMHLKPGIYQASISALNNMGQVLEESKFQISVSQCTELNQKVTF